MTGEGSGGFAAYDLVLRGITLRGFWPVNWFRKTPPDQIVAAFGKLIELLHAGELTMPLAATYSLSRIADALKHAARSLICLQVVAHHALTPGHEVGRVPDRRMRSQVLRENCLNDGIASVLMKQ